MKTPLLLAALLLTAPAAANAQNSSRAGSDDPNMSGTTQRMFIINATTPGGLTFSGAGTATFNNAVGTSNQFNVGSNTSIGVNASVSATQEFDGLSLGVMQLGAGSSLMQTNGTSSSAAATQAALLLHVVSVRRLKRGDAANPACAAECVRLCPIPAYAH